jgi:hypothetical protein
MVIQEEIANSHLLEDFSSASGDSMPARNAACHFKCNFKIKSKRAACWQDCDRRFPRSDAQAQRRDEQSQRRTARNIKRDTVDECKDLYKSGQINKIEEQNCINNARETKREIVTEKGGGKLFTRVGRGFTRVFPITAASRGGALKLIQNNTAGFATRLAPALVPQAEANQKFDSQAIQLAKKGWERIKKTWRNAGGSDVKLREAILKGYRKKPEKLPRSERKASGVHGEQYSNAVSEAVLTTIIVAGAGLLSTLIGVIANAGVRKNPYKSNSTPDTFRAGFDNVETNVPVDPNFPTVDPRTGEWVDPQTGRPVDPRTGQQLILGMNPYLAIGLGVVVLAGAGFGIYRLVKS